ncbi:glucosaminidase domain-containing protein [Alphaproteobacteria bacterium LSUCC0684]
MAPHPNVDLQRILVLSSVGLVALKFLMIGVIGLKPPEFHGGASKLALNNLPSISENTSSADRRAQLEDMLAPIPELRWASPNKDFHLPDKNPSLAQTKPPSAGTTEIAPMPEPGIRVARVYLQTLPDLTSLGTDQRKDQFIAYMLPLLLRANEEIRQRQKLIRKTIAENDMDRLYQWAELYGIDTSGEDMETISRALAVRVNTVPVSLALAQAAVESGWGTSRFVAEGNALFGQWAWSLDAGIQPQEPRYENAVVRSFSSLFDSTRAYIHNLNTHYAYVDFRRKRLELSTPPTAEEINELVASLHPYSEEGDQYIDMLRTIIASNDLWIYDHAVLEEE